MEGGVGDEGREEGIQGGLESCIGSEIGSFCAVRSAVYWSCFTCETQQPKQGYKNQVGCSCRGFEFEDTHLSILYLFLCLFSQRERVL